MQHEGRCAKSGHDQQQDQHDAHVFNRICVPTHNAQQMLIAAIADGDFVFSPKFRGSR